MNRLERIAVSGRYRLRQALCVATAGCLWLLMSPLAWAAKKKVEQAVDESKGYTIPYMFVIALLGLGLMTVLRPSSRRDKAEEQKQEAE